MLKVEHPTDYPTKEGVNSEITDQIEEEQHTEHVYLAQKQISILKRLKRSDSDNEENIDNPQSGPSGNTAQVSSVDDSEEFFDAEENLEENHEPMEVEQQGTSKQTGTVSRKRPSTEEQDKSEAKKVKLSPQKEKVKERLNTFVKAFITDFSKELAISHVRAQGKQVTLEEAIAELKQGVTGALVSYSIAYTAAASVPSAGTSARNIAGKFIHIGKTKAIKITKAFEKAHEGGLSQILSEAAAKIFRSFESQFMIVTDEAGDKMAMRKLAEDAVYRTLNYIAKNSESTSSDFITKGVILGKSEGILKRGYTLKGKSGEDLNTGELYKETGVAVSEGRVNRYYSNNRGKYGYRLPLTFEKEHGIKHLLTLLERRQFQEDQHAQETKYIYILQPGDIEKESSEILKEIEKAKPATKGDIETITGILPESAEKLQTLKDIKFIPKDLVENFTGREEELEKLDELLNPSSDDNYIAVVQGIRRLSINRPDLVKSSNTQASLSGLGGIGKTQLALKYAEEYAEYYNNNVIWINAETPGEILNSVRRLLNLGKFNEFRRKYGINSVSEIDENITEGNIEVMVHEIYDYFKSTKSLFIFDNVKDYNEIKRYLPSKFIGCKPHILITSRYQNWENTQVKVLVLDVFTDQEADKFIRNILKIEGNDSSKDQDIKNLASELQRLPLALAQAVAYIKVVGGNTFGIPEYLEEYRTEAQKLLDSDHFQRFFHDPYAKTVFTTWKVTLDKIAEDKSAGKEAIELLNIIAYLCPDNISYEVLGIKSSEKLNEAISLLKSYSMINERAKKNVLNIHRLVQKVTRINLEEDKQQFQRIAEKIKRLTKGYLYNKEVELHYLHFLLYISYNVELTEKLKLLTSRERILYIPFYSDDSVSSLVHLLNTSYAIDTKEKHLQLLGEALSVYVNIPSLPLLEETIKYVKSREQEEVILQGDILVILHHTHQRFNEMRKRRGFKPKTLTKESNEYKALSLLYEFKDEYTQEPISCLLQGQRRKRSPESCLFSWEDTDEFNEEKDEARDPNKIRINSENFIGHIGDIPEEKKQDQLIQFAGQHEVTGSAKESVNKLIKHQKVKLHLEKVGKISHKLNTGLIVKNIGSDLLRGDYENVGINLGLIGGGVILGKASQKVLEKGVALEADKKLLSSVLKTASPFLAHGTSTFFVYNLIRNIKEYKSGNKDALDGIISNAIFVGVDAAEAGVEAAELLEIIEGVSEFTGPIGEALTASIFLGMEIYHAKKQVEEIEKHVHLTEAEELTEGVRAFFGLDPSEEIEERIEVKERNNLLVKNAIEFLKKNTDISRYVFPSIIEKSLTYWKGITKHDNDYDQQKEIYCKNTAKYECKHFTTLSLKIMFEVYNVSFPCVEDSNVDLRKIKRYVKFSENAPDKPDEGNLLCTSGNEDVDIRAFTAIGSGFQVCDKDLQYLCKNANGIEYNVNRTGSYTLIALGGGNDTAIGTPDSSNIFIVNNGHKNYTGGNKNDWFILQGDNITGILNGMRGVNTLDLSEFAPNTTKLFAHFYASDATKLNTFFYVLYTKNLSSIDFSDKNAFRIREVNNIIGRQDKADSIDIGVCDVKLVDGNGGHDCFSISKKSSCDYNMQVVVRPNTTVNNEAKGNFIYNIKNEEGEASINLRSINTQSNHRFIFNYMLSELSGIYVENKYRIRFNFSRVTNDSFSLTVSYNTANNTQYILNDHTEVYVINKYNFYAQQNTNKTVEGIISDYTAVANRLNMTMLFKLSNNETMLIGHGRHEMMHNNPSFTSHLVGNGGENIYVITSVSNNTEKFPVPEVTLYGLNMGNFTDTLDLRKVVQQSKIECPDSQVLPKVNKDNNDLIIKLYSNYYFSSGSCINLSAEFLISSVRLKGALADSWYEKLDITLNNAPMKIKDNGKFWKLESLPLTFNRDKEIIVITPDDVEKDTELVTPREAGNYVFARSRNDLIITNAFDQGKSERCTISLKDFYQNTKMQTLSIKFADKEITLKDHQEQISIARNIDVMKKEHKDQIYNDVFNNTRSKNISLEVNETTTHEIRHKHRHEHSRHKHQNTIEHQRRRRAINTKAIRSSNASDDLEFFAAQNNAIFVMGNDGISSAARTPSLISDLFAWIKSSIGGLFNSRAALPENNTTQSSISQVDAQVGVNDTIILLDLLIRKVTGKKHISTEGQSMSLLEAQGYALNITTKFEQVLNETAFKSGISATNLNFNPVAVQSTIVEKIISGKFSEIPTTLCLSAKEACPEFKQTNKFLHCLGVHLEKILAEKETILLLNKQKVSSHSKSLGQLTSRIPEKVTAAELSKEDKPDTFLNSASITRSIGNVLGL